MKMEVTHYITESGSKFGNSRLVSQTLPIHTVKLDLTLAQAKLRTWQGSIHQCDLLVF